MFRNMFKRILLITIALYLLAVLTFPSLAATDGFGNFTYSGDYKAGKFRDVNESQWFASYVEDACNYGFFRGKSENIFDHAGLLTLGEAVTLVARLNSIYHTGNAFFEESTPFYTVYADYAISHGIIDSHGDYNAPASRAQFAQLAYSALPPEAFPVINEIADYGICDVMADSDFATAVYTLYRAGILAGSDRYGTFYPNSNITRAEACAIMVRLANPTARVKTKLPVRIPAEVIFQRSADAVFLLEMFNSKGKSIRTGSGFFISDTGLAVTNLHVFENAASAEVTLFDGDVYPVLGVYAISEEYNLTIFSVDSDVNGFHYLNLADSDLVEAGNTVYALGSPRDLINTFSDGIISNTNRIVDESAFLQFTAPISFGSGGSPVLNPLGQVVGVASSSFSYGQNLNLAVPVNFIKSLETGEFVTLEELLRNGN